MAALLETRSVRKVYYGRRLLGRGSATAAVDGVSLRIAKDQPSFITIAGESGSGKTTVARLLLGFTQPTSGQVLYRGALVPELSRSQMRAFRQDVQAIFQDPFEVYNPFYKIDHILTTPIRKFGLSHSVAERRDMIDQALQAVGLRPDETLGRYPHQLSGGQRQRITIARALLVRPRLIIADEPVSMVDASMRATILDNLQRLYHDFGISFLYISHDLTTAYQVSEEIIVLYRGCVVEAGNVEQVIHEPRHPYTKELIASIPVPEPGREWIEQAPPGSRDAGEDSGAADAGGAAGCRFAPRCPHAMGRCRRERPPLYRTDPTRLVACFLYADAPVAAADEGITALGSETRTASADAQDASDELDHPV